MAEEKVPKRRGRKPGQKNRTTGTNVTKRSPNEKSSRTGKLNAAHKRVIHELIFNISREYKKDIAIRNGFSYNTLKEYLNERNQTMIAIAFREEWNAQMNSFKTEFRDELERDAFKELARVFRYSKDHQVRLKAAMFIMEKMTDNTNPTKLDVNMDPINITIDYGEE